MQVLCTAGKGVCTAGRFGKSTVLGMPDLQGSLVFSMGDAKPAFCDASHSRCWMGEHFWHSRRFPEQLQCDEFKRLDAMGRDLENFWRSRDDQGRLPSIAARDIGRVHCLA